MTSPGPAIPMRALESPNFRSFFFAQCVALVGTWMTRMAIGWLLYRLTDSPFMLGLIGFSGQIWSFLLAPVAGVAADRYDRRRILVITQSLTVTGAFILGVLTVTGWARPWTLIALSVFTGCVDAFDMTTRQAFVPGLLDEKDALANAIALNSISFNAARLIGPALAGLLVSWMGEGACFFLDALGRSGVVRALVRLDLKPREPGRPSSRGLDEILEGARYARGSPSIRFALSSVALVGFVGMSYTVLLPIFARDVLGGGARTMGFLMSAVGLGTLVGSVFVSRPRPVLALAGRIHRMALVGGLTLVAFSASRSYPLSLAALLGVGFTLIVQLASSNTLLQMVVDDDKRGRVMSFYTMASLGSAPLGNLAFGVLAQRWGGPLACLVGGLFYSLLSLGLLAQMRGVSRDQGPENR